jgi:hypothetical protein
MSKIFSGSSTSWIGLIIKCLCSEVSIPFDVPYLNEIMNGKDN